MVIEDYIQIFRLAHYLGKSDNIVNIPILPDDEYFSEYLKIIETRERYINILQDVYGIDYREMISPILSEEP